MNFQSFHFILFLVTLVVACGLLWRNFAARKNLLLLASYYFYMCWDWRFAGLLIATTLLHYVVAIRLAQATDLRVRRAWLLVSVVGALGVLAYFKYANFFLQSAVSLANVLGLEAHAAVLQVVLPIGISFYTFQALSYVLDVYRREQEPTRDLRDFALFVGFFATVLAGPITRASELLSQFEKQQTVPGPDVERALALVAQGFIKKIIFADVLAAQIVDPAFANPGAYSPLFLLVAVYAFSFQIYMDVSGYTDIARGSALLCGFRLPPNFDRPYLARSVSNFWQRWHMSMSGFFRNYVFIGLGGSRYGNVYLNLMLTFLAIGLWHGGGWNFLLYGALHGSMVCLERLLRRRKPAQAPGEGVQEGSALVTFLQIALVFQFVAFTRILFRAHDLDAAARYLQAMFQFGHGVAPFSVLSLALLAAAALLHWGIPSARLVALDRLRRIPVPLQAVALVTVVYVCMAFSAGKPNFVYFLF